MNRNSNKKQPELYSEQPKRNQDNFDRKALERALDRWVNEGGATTDPPENRPNYMTKNNPEPAR
jgi:hypothetical protein